MNGQGKLTWTDKYKGKAVYKGNFLVNHFHGKGKLAWSNGDLYSGKSLIFKTNLGNFENGHYQGYGEFYWADGKRSYKGEFHKGKFHNIGMINFIQIIL